MSRSAFAATFLLALALVSPSSAHAGELLSNGGFEQGVASWQASHGQLVPVDTPTHGGAAAARLVTSGLQSHEVYRFVSVAPGAHYQLSAWVLLNDPGVERVFLRVSWFNSAGGLVSQADSSWLTIPGPHYQHLTTGYATSPLAAVSARIGLRVQVSGPSQLHFDDFSFTGPPALPPTPVPTPALPTSPTPVVTNPPTVPPSAPAKTPTPPATASSSPTPVDERDVFDRLTNGGFESLRGDGTAYAWKDVGADLGAPAQPAVEGVRVLAVTSRTSSTKWAYQTVRIQPGHYYDAAGYALTGASDETFLRVSWYRTPDGSGSAIDSVDSPVSVAGTAFQRLSTGPVQAPGDALTAKVRLMLRPGSSAETTAFFDAITFDTTSARPSQADATDDGDGPAGPRSNSGASHPGDSDADSGADFGGEARVENYPVGFANVKPAATVAPSLIEPTSSTYDWLAVMAIAIGIAAIAFAVMIEWAKKKRDDVEGPP